MINISIINVWVIIRIKKGKGWWGYSWLESMNLGGPNIYECSCESARKRQPQLPLSHLFSFSYYFSLSYILLNFRINHYYVCLLFFFSQLLFTRLPAEFENEFKNYLQIFFIKWLENCKFIIDKQKMLPMIVKFISQM